MRIGGVSGGEVHRSVDGAVAHGGVVAADGASAVVDGVVVAGIGVGGERLSWRPAVGRRGEADGGWRTVAVAVAVDAVGVDAVAVGAVAAVAEAQTP